MRAHLVMLLLVLPGLAGCLQARPGDAGSGSVTAGTAYPYDGAFRTDDTWSHTLRPGPYAALEVEEIFMPSFDGTKIHMGVFRPDVPEGTKVPVIIDAGPYYGELDEAATSADTHRLGGFLIENFVPHGYAIAQVSVRGTGLSTGCMDYFGAKEQRDLDAVVTFLGEQAWSSGAVAMIGRSYDGSTPWEAASFGNPYLKTIVPIEGIDDFQQLHFRNGTAEFRSVALGTQYYTFGATQGGPNTQDPSKTQPDDARLASREGCADGPQHAPMGVYGYLTGGGHGVPGPADDYWTSREFTGRVLERYQGSLFWVHGLQDWNVNPSQGLSVYKEFHGTKKALLGQWAHNYADRPEEHNNLRWDWAEMLLRWFDRELKGVDTDVGPALEIEDHRGNWRVEPEAQWPPADAEWTPLFPSADGSLLTDGGAAKGTLSVFAPAPLALADQEATPIAPRVLAFASAPFENETRLSGQPRLHITVQSPTPGGNIWAELWEVPAQGDPVQVGRAQMDLRYAAGGRSPTPYVPNTPVVAMMEFYPLDARILAGSTLQLLLTGESGGYLPSAASSQLTFTFGADQTTLELPTVEREFKASRWDVDSTEVTGSSA
ncbi:MAG TPA: CocE/NonD family hydrolase [Candidatus Thermoplasmatota archaeon]|nr:CocE/NonD family hydrolase [Candidatus Thermoplasmatota archaeon]